MVFYCRLIPDDGGYVVEFPDASNVITEGDTVEEALAMAAEALNAVLECTVAQGLPLPKRSTGPRRGLYPIEVEPHILIAWEFRKLRGERSQAEIAGILKMSYQAYQRLENPCKANPTVKTLEKVAKAFGKRLEIGLV